MPFPNMQDLRLVLENEIEIKKISLETQENHLMAQDKRFTDLWFSRRIEVASIRTKGETIYGEKYCSINGQPA